MSDLEVNLTKDAKGSLALIYRAYEQRRRNGISKSQAEYFDGLTADSVQLNQQISDNISELKKAGFISCDIVGGILLKDAAIIYMENKTADTIKEWLSFASQFIP